MFTAVCVILIIAYHLAYLLDKTNVDMITPRKLAWTSELPAILNLGQNGVAKYTDNVTAQNVVWLYS